MPPGAAPFWSVRQRLGGRVLSALFFGAVEELLEAGEVIEVWLQRTDGRTASHLLLLPGHSDELRSRVAQARGRADRLAAEPWVVDLRPGLDDSRPGRLIPLVPGS
jgi:hypothetical protein